jgi:hypothetical protein
VEKLFVCFRFLLLSVSLVDGAHRFCSTWFSFVICSFGTEAFVSWGCAFSQNFQLECLFPQQITLLTNLIVFDPEQVYVMATSATTSTNSESSNNARFLRAQNKCFSGFAHSSEGTWKGDFSFVQLADSQVMLVISPRALLKTFY